MSVYVKGMDMPKNCIECPMEHRGWCLIAPLDISERVAPTIEDAYKQGRPEWCPLAEIPTPHGPLIDKEELYNRFAKLEEKAQETFNKLKPYDRVWAAILTERTAYKFDVFDAQEIIPAEGELREVKR